MDNAAVLSLLLSTLRVQARRAMPGSIILAIVVGFGLACAECRSVSILSIRKAEIDWLSAQLNAGFVVDLIGAAPAQFLIDA